MGQEQKPKGWQDIARGLKEKETASLKSAHASQVKSYQSLIEDLEHRLEVLIPLAGHVVNPREFEVKATGKNSAIAVAVASDWHVEETVTSSHVNGLNYYNLRVARERITRFTQNVVRLVNIQRSGADIDTLVLALLGDFMNGFIHEEYQETNGLSPIETILWLLEEMSVVLTYLRKHGRFKKIIVPCSVGNHGRTTRKPRSATGRVTNYEWLLYHVLAQRFTDGFEWRLSDSYHNYLPVAGQVLRFHHGDGLKYQGGVGGLTIPLEKAISSWNKGRKADIDVFGHWHTQQQNPRWVANGSLIGFNSYAITIKAPYEPPQQTLFLMSPKRGRTVTAPIFLTEK